MRTPRQHAFAGAPSLLEQLMPEQPSTAPLSRAAGFALQMGLAELWRSWGIEPDVVYGRGLGEYAAACVAGVTMVGDVVKLAE